jgi:hypothetical protein
VKKSNVFLVGCQFPTLKSEQKVTVKKVNRVQQHRLWEEQVYLTSTETMISHVSSKTMCLRWKYFYNTLSFILLCLVQSSETTNDTLRHPPPPSMHPNLFQHVHKCIWNPSKAIGRAGTPFFWKKTFHSDKVKNIHLFGKPRIIMKFFACYAQHIFLALLALLKNHVVQSRIEQQRNTAFSYSATL